MGPNCTVLLQSNCTLPLQSFRNGPRFQFMSLVTSVFELTDSIIFFTHLPISLRGGLCHGAGQFFFLPVQLSSGHRARGSCWRGTRSSCTERTARAPYSAWRGHESPGPEVSAPEGHRYELLARHGVVMSHQA